jgi:flagellar basal-body rod protein FlgF
MSYGLYISAEGAQAQTRRLDVIANNLANVDTVAFKRDLAICQARYAEGIQSGGQSPGMGSLSDIGGGVMVAATVSDQTVGPLKHTQVPTDLAIEGDAYFEVKRGDERLLTRAGNFRLTSTGQLVNQQGLPVLNDTGATVNINPEGGPWEITADGVLMQRGSGEQRLSMLRPKNRDEVTKIGDNLLRPTGETEVVPPELRRVSAGFLELSGVRPTNEMVDMIETTRLFEANVNMMKTQDQMLSELVNRGLKV